MEEDIYFSSKESLRAIVRDLEDDIDDLKQQILDAEEVIRAAKEALQDGSIEFGHKEAVKILDKYGAR
jgi:hypothetical protein